MGIFKGIRFAKNVEMSAVCSNQWEKDRKKFNTITFSLLGIGIAKFTVAENVIPDIADGQKISVDLVLSCHDGKLSLKPAWETLQVLGVDQSLIMD